MKKTKKEQDVFSPGKTPCFLCFPFAAIRINGVPILDLYKFIFIFHAFFLME